MNEAKAGDFFVTSMGGFVGFLVGVMEFLYLFSWKRPFAKIKLSKYRHAGVCIGGGYAVEAQPGGARVVSLSKYFGQPLAFSTGKLTGVDAACLQRVAAIAVGLEGTKYSFLDYLAIALKRMHINLPWVMNRVKSSGHLICSQLVALAYLRAGHPLYSFWSGDVIPSELAEIIGAP